MDRGFTSFETQLGPMLMGTVFNYFLFGIFLMQLFHYYNHYAASDKLFFKALVIATTCIEIAHLVVSTDLTYYSTVKNYANPMALLISPHSTFLMPLLNGFAGFCVHIFFTWRIMLMSKTRAGKLAAALIFMTALLTLGAAMATTISYYRPGINRDVFKATAAGRTPLSVWLTASAACDIFITATMVSLLWSAKRVVEFSPSKGVLNLLIAHTIENGLITAVCAVADQITFFTLPALNLTYLCLTAVLGRFYAIVLLTSLNGRDRARQQLRGQNTKLSSHNTDSRNADSIPMSATYDASSSGKGGQTQSKSATSSFPIFTVSTVTVTHADIEARGDDTTYNDHKDHKMYS